MWYSHIFKVPDYSDRVPDFSIFSLLKVLLQNEVFVNLHFPVFSTNWNKSQILYLYKSKTLKYISHVLMVFFVCISGIIYVARAGF